MSISQPYPAPPIIDSIVELRLKNPLSKRDQDSVVRAIKPNYDKHEESGEVDVQVRIDQGKVEAQTSQPKPVHLFSNNDQTDFCRIEPSKLHWSRLPPYEGWDSFKRHLPDGRGSGTPRPVPPYPCQHR